MRAILETLGLWQNHPKFEAYLENFEQATYTFNHDQMIEHFKKLNLDIDDQALYDGVNVIHENQYIRRALEFLIFVLVIEGHPSMHIVKNAKITSDVIDGDLFELMVILSLIDPSIRAYQKKGIDEKHIHFNTGHLKGFILNFYKKHKKLGIENFGWTTYLASLGLIQIKSLNFMHHFYHDPFYGFQHKETKTLLLICHPGKQINRYGQFSGTNHIDDVSFITTYCEDVDAYEGFVVDPSGKVMNQIVKLEKKEWDLVIKEETPVIDFHIPTKTPYAIEDIKSSLEEAQSFFNQYFNYDYQAFYCVSWLYAPQIESVIKKKNSRIIDIYKQGYVAPSTVGIQAVYNFIFQNENPDFDQIKPNSSLQRDIIAYVKEGHMINCGMYLYLMDDMNMFGHQVYRDRFKNSIKLWVKE